MTSTRKLIVGAIVGSIAIGGSITGVAVASGGGDSDHHPITGPAHRKATQKALQIVGEGHVSETEQGDEESYYQVEVTKNDGSHVDVNLDRRFQLVKTKHETETKGRDANDGDGND